MGLLTDDDMHQLLFLIDPETFDEGICRGNVWLLLVCLFLFWFWQYLMRRLFLHLNQSSIRPSISFSLIVKSLLNPFLEPTSTKQWGVKFLAQGNNMSLWLCLNQWLTDCKSDVLSIVPRWRRKF